MMLEMWFNAYMLLSTIKISTCSYRNPQGIENAKYKRNVKFSLTMSCQNVIYACIEGAAIQQRGHKVLRISHRGRAGGRGEICGAAA
jgi:hypothetical protein